MSTSSRSAKRKDLVGAGTSQEDSKDLLSGKVHSVTNHKLFAKPLLYLLVLSIILHIGAGGLTRIRSGR